jgi:hypothetical protein
MPGRFSPHGVKAPADIPVRHRLRVIFDDLALAI